MGRYQVWKANLRDNRNERIQQAAREDEAEEAERARQRVLEEARLRAVPPYLELHLQPADWLDFVSRTGSTSVDLRVCSIHEPIMYRDGVGWVRVWGHAPACPPRPSHAPCVSAMVRVGAILAAVPS